MVIIIGRPEGLLAIGRPAGYWLLDALWAIGYWTPCGLLDIGDGLLGMGRFAIGYRTLCEQWVKQVPLP